MFIQPVSMKIPSRQDYERDLKPQLLKLGYKENWSQWRQSAPYLVTMAWSTNKDIGFNENSHYAKEEIKSYNPQLFLALAGMTDDPAIKVGDWLMSLDTSCDYDEGKLYQVYTYDEGCITSLQSYPETGAKKTVRHTLTGELHFRKATREEVIQHFKSVVETVSPAGDFGTESAGNPPIQIPKYFVVKRDSSPEWKEYIKWLNETYDTNWGGDSEAFYGFDGGDEDYNGTNWFYEIEDFKNNPQVFETAAEFMKLVNNQPMRKVTDLTDKQVIHCPTEEEAEAICKLIHEAGIKYCSGKPFLNRTNWHEYQEKTCYSPHRGKFSDTEGMVYRGCEFLPAKDFLPPSFYKQNKQNNMKRILSRADFKRIHAVACSDWKTKLAETFKDLLIQDEVVVDESYYKAMRKACTPEQHKLFDEIFGEDKDKYRIRKGVFQDVAHDENLQAFCTKAFESNNVIEILQGAATNSDDCGRGLWLKGNWEIRKISGGVVAIPVK